MTAQPEGSQVDGGAPLLAIHDLWVRYPRTRRFRDSLRRPFHREYVSALKGLSLEIRQGEVLTVVGANGAGKTTLCRVAAGLLERSRGEISFLGKPIERSSELRGKVGVTSSEERSFLFRLSSCENLLLFGMLSGLTLSQAKHRAEESLKALEAWDYAHLPFMYCSTGMRQRVNIARAMLSLPALVILDEPTKSVDPVSARHLRQFVRTNLAGRGRAVLWCTHILSEVEEFGGRTAVLHGGSLAYLGSPEHLQDIADAPSANDAGERSSVADAIYALLESRP